MLRGDLGQPPGGLPPGAAEEGAEGREADHRAARLLLKDVDLRRCAPSSRASSSARSTIEFASSLMYPKVFADFAEAQDGLRPDQRAADAGLFLRHALGGRDLRRHRARQDAGDPLPRGRRDQREGPGPRLLRAQRPAAHRHRAGPQPRRRRLEAPAQGRAGRRRAGRRADAGRHLVASPSRSARRSPPATCCCRSKR